MNPPLHRLTPILPALLLLVPLAAPAQSLKPFTVEGLFRASFPGTPELKDTTLDGGRTREWTARHPGGAVFSVQLHELPAVEGPKEGRFLAQMHEKVESEASFAKVRTVEIAHRGLSGRRYSIPTMEAVAFEPAPGIGVALAIAHDRDLPPNAQDFFDAFEWLGGDAQARPVARQKERKGGALDGFQPLKSGREFSVLMPQGSGARQVDTPHLPAGLWTGQDGDFGYAVHFRTLSVEELERVTAEDFLDREMKGMLRSERDVLAASRRISLHGYPGRELTVKTGQDLADIRIYLVGTRVYTLFVERPNGMETPNRDAFFESLELHDRPRKVATKKKATKPQ